MDLERIQRYLREQRKKSEESNLPLKSVRVIDLGAGEVRFPGLPMGAANGVVLEDLLGYSSEAIGELKAKGAI